MLKDTSGENGADGPAVVQSESLSTRARRMRAALKESVAGPYLVAAEVHTIVRDWDLYEHEAKGLTATAWLKSVFGGEMGAAYWSRRHEAVQTLGESIRRTVSQDVAVWLSGLRLTPEQRAKARDMLILGCRKNARGMPLTLSTAKSLLREEFGFAYATHLCSSCVALERKLGLCIEAMSKAGIVLPDELLGVGVE